MPTLVPQALRRRWVDDPAAAVDALDRYAEFARICLLDDTAAPRWGTTVTTRVRIYNSPRLALLRRRVRPYRPSGAALTESDAAAEQIFAANLASVAADGYAADPLANDQVWALTLWLRHGG